MKSERLAINLMIAQSLLFAAETMVIHHIGSGVSVMQVAVLRGAAGLLLALFLARKIGWRVVQTDQLPVQLLRGAVTLLYLWVMIYSFSLLPFADATAISYTQAAYIALFSVLILGEAVSRVRWGAALVGIGGALLISKPAFAGWSSAYVFALIGTSLNGLSFVLNRYLQRSDSEATTMFYANLIPVLGSLPALAIAGPPSTTACFWLLPIMVLGPLGVYCGIAAVRHANASMLGPYTLLRLVVAFFAGMVIFHEVPDTFGSLGVVLILASCVISSWCGTGRSLRLPGPARAGTAT